MPAPPKMMAVDSKAAPGKRTQPVRIGFVPLCDAAPLVMARELHLFEEYGVKVQLCREIGWATLRDKLCYGDLDAAHALAPLLFALNLGLGVTPTECVTALVLNRHGNAITLGRSLLPRQGEPAEAALGRLRR